MCGTLLMCAFMNACGACQAGAWGAATRRVLVDTHILMRLPDLLAAAQLLQVCSGIVNIALVCHTTCATAV